MSATIETGTAYPTKVSGFIPGFMLVVSVLLIFLVLTNPIVTFRLPMTPTDHFHPTPGLFGVLTKSVVWPLLTVNCVIPSLIRTSWDTTEVFVIFVGAHKLLWLSNLVIWSLKVTI